MKTMKIFMVLFALLIVAGTSYAQTLQKMEFTNVLTVSKSYSGSASDTTSSSIIPIEGDSLGFVIEANADSMSGNVRLQYLSPNQYGDTTTLAYYTVGATLPINGKAVFGTKISPGVTQGWARLWLISKNNKTTTQTASLKVYRVRRR